MAYLMLSTGSQAGTSIKRKARRALVFVECLLSLLFLLENARILSLNSCRIDIIPTQQIKTTIPTHREKECVHCHRAGAPIRNTQRPLIADA